jgi:glucan biosynthesis protein C
VFQVLWSLDAWAWLVLILSVGIRFLHFSSPTVRYANQAVLPFYILHQPVIFAAGFFVVQWHLGIAGQYLCLSTISLAVTLALYELLIKRIRLMRAAFGMG